MVVRHSSLDDLNTPKLHDVFLLCCQYEILLNQRASSNRRRMTAAAIIIEIFILNFAT